MIEFAKSRGFERAMRACMKLLNYHCFAYNPSVELLIKLTFLTDYSVRFVETFELDCDVPMKPENERR